MTTVSIHLALHDPSTPGFGLAALQQISIPGPCIVLSADAARVVASDTVELELVSNIDKPRVLAQTLQFALDTINAGLPETERVEAAILDGAPTVAYEVTDPDIAAFKQAWHEVDDQKRQGGDIVTDDRTRAGLAAVFAARAAR